MAEEEKITKKIPLCLKCYSIPTISFGENKDIRLICRCEKEQSIEEYLNLFVSITFPNQCENHPDQPSVVYCVNCKKYFCMECAESHIANSKNPHLLIDWNILSILFCREHQMDIEYYCDICPEYFCEKGLEEHVKDHHLIHLPTLSSNIKIEQLKEKIKEGETYLNEYYPKIKENYIKLVEKEYEDSLNRNKTLFELYSTMINNYIPGKIMMYPLIKNIKAADLKLKEFNEEENYLQFLKDNTIMYRKKMEFEMDSFQCIKTIEKHTNQVSSFLVLKDGRIASCSVDKTINIYNPKNNYNLDLTIDAQTNLLSVCELDDGRLASCGFYVDSNIRIWEINEKSYKCVDTLIGHTDRMNKVVCLPSKRLVSCSFDKTIKIWDISSTGKCIKTLTEHTAPVSSLLLMSDKKYMVSGSHDETLRVWDINTYNNQTTIQDVYCNSTNCLIEMDTNRVAVGGTTFIKIVNVSTAQIELTITIDEYNTSLLLLRDGNLLIGEETGNIYHYNLKEKKILKKTNCHSKYLFCLAYVNEDEIISGSGDKTIKIWID